MLTWPPSTSSRGGDHSARAPIDAAKHDHLWVVGVVPRRHDRFEIPGLGVERRVDGHPVEGGIEERQLVVQPGIGVLAHAGARQPTTVDELAPAVSRPGLGDRDPLPVGRHADDLGPPRARLRKHLVGELLVRRPVAAHDEERLGGDDCEHGDAPPDDPRPRSSLHETATTAPRGRSAVRRRLSRFVSQASCSTHLPSSPPPLRSEAGPPAHSAELLSHLQARRSAWCARSRVHLRLARRVTGEVDDDDLVSGIAGASAVLCATCTGEVDLAAYAEVIEYFHRAGVWTQLFTAIAEASGSV